MEERIKKVAMERAEMPPEHGNKLLPIISGFATGMLVIFISLMLLYIFDLIPGVDGVEKNDNEISVEKTNDQNNVNQTEDNNVESEGDINQKRSDYKIGKNDKLAYIEAVKTFSFEEAPQITYDMAFSYYYSSPKWKYVDAKSKDSYPYVVFCGEEKREKKIKVEIWFALNIIDEINLNIPEVFVKKNGKKLGDNKAIVEVSKSYDAYIKYVDEKYEELLQLDADEILFTEKDLEGLSAVQLTYLRNSIYAWYGYIFDSEELNNYFEQFDWYEPDEEMEAEYISKKEKKNEDFILDYQKKHNLEYTPK